LYLPRIERIIRKGAIPSSCLDLHLALGCVVAVDAFEELFCASTRGFIDNVAAAPVANISANSIIDNELGRLIRTLVAAFVFIRSVMLVIHSTNVSAETRAQETTRLRGNSLGHVPENIISTMNSIVIVLLANYCPRCGKKIVKWFETWYAQGNCSCLSVENKTLGTRDEEY
jgi:hypothetical protein